MDEFFRFASREYFLMLGLLLLARGMDALSTWIATPNLVLEGNPIAKKLGWRWGLPVNLGFALALAFWPLPAIVISTTSVLVAARNFQSAWLMRSLGEQVYRDWHVARIQETRITLYLFCLAGNTLLTAGVGAAVIYFSSIDDARTILMGTSNAATPKHYVPFAIGLGIIAYASAVAFYTLLAIWRMRRAGLRELRLKERGLSLETLKPFSNVQPAGLEVRNVAQVEGR